MLSTLAVFLKNLTIMLINNDKYDRFRLQNRSAPNYCLQDYGFES